MLRDRSIGSEGVAGTIADSSAICLYLDRKLETGPYGSSAFDAGRIAALEECMDTELAQPLGMKLFRPILFRASRAKPLTSRRQDKPIKRSCRII